MDVTLHLPDNIGSLSPVAQLDTVMSAALAVLLKLASDGTQASKASAAIAVGVMAPFGVDNYGRPFKDKAEADAYASALAIHDANQQGNDGSAQAVLKSDAKDVRELTSEDLKFVGVFVNEFLASPDVLGPTSAMHALSGFLDYGIQDKGDGTVVAPDGFPQIDWPVDVAKEVKATSWNWQQYQGPARALLAKRRGVIAI